MIEPTVHAIALNMEREHGLELAADLARSVARQEDVHNVPTRGFWAKVADVLARREGTIRMGFAGERR
jgi:hypothetical protein